jgi:hypothetical protein
VFPTSALAKNGRSREARRPQAIGYAVSCLFAGPCPGPDLARSVQGVAADPAESRPGAAAGCPALSGGFLGMDLVGLIDPILFRYPSLLDEVCDVRWPTRDAHRNDVVASRP